MLPTLPEILPCARHRYDFLAKPTVETLPVSRDTGNCFGRLKSALKAKGKPLPINDVWLAAQCLETGAVLLTYDPHFAAIDGLRVWPEVEPQA
jgi:predicted nucleic acid-binding protein